MNGAPNQNWDESSSPFRWVIWLLLIVFLVAGGLLLVRRPSPPSPPLVTTAVAASAGRLTYSQDDGGNLTVVNRQTGPEIWYRVTLNNAPLGQKLPLDCEWVDPNGVVVKQNHYTTKEIDKAVWPTHARCKFGMDAAPGIWTVKLSLEGRVLHEMKFEVKDGAGLPAEKGPL